jgi:hypothetical protein
MGRLVKLSMGEASILIESSDIMESGAIVQAGGAIDLLNRNFEKLLDIIEPISKAIVEKFKNLTMKPDSASAQFSLSLTAEGNIFIVKASGEGSLTITLNWSFANNGGTS